MPAVSYHLKQSNDTNKSIKKPASSPCLLMKPPSVPVQEYLGCEGYTIGPGDEKYLVQHVVNNGSFGHIFVGENADGGPVMIKAERQGTGREKILHEGNIYRKLEGQPGIPRVHWYGMHGSKFNFLVMEKLGPSLDDIFHRFGKNIPLRIVLYLIPKIIDTIMCVHYCNIIHRDVSPANFVFGEDDFQKLYLIDFGLAKTCHAHGKILMPTRSTYSFNFTKRFVGTPNFVSLNIHNGLPEGRCDDLESVAYLLVFLLKGCLPWMGLEISNNEDALTAVWRLKSQVAPQAIAEDLPKEFAIFIDYCRKLKACEIPDYEGIKSLFSSLAKNLGIDIATVDIGCELVQIDGESGFENSDNCRMHPLSRSLPSL